MEASRPAHNILSGGIGHACFTIWARSRNSERARGNHGVIETVDEEEGYGMWRLASSLPQIASQMIVEMILKRGGIRILME